MSARGNMEYHLHNKMDIVGRDVSFLILIKQESKIR
jgi:hypothetical protein